MNASFAGIPLDKPLRLGEVARRLNMTTQQTRRVLLRLEKRFPGILQRGPGKFDRYTTTLRQLRRAWPRLGLAETADTLTNLEERVRILENRVKRRQSAPRGPDKAA